MRVIVKGLLKSIPTVLVMAACVAVAGRLEALAYGGVFVTLTVIVLLLFFAAMVWAYFIPWMKSEFVVSLCPVPVVVLVIVSYYSGFTGPDLFNSFNLAYVGQICLVIGLPWVGGTALGSHMARRKQS